MTLHQQIRKLQEEVNELKRVYLSPDHQYLDELYVLKHCAKHFDITTSGLIGRLRTAKIVSARRVSIKCVDRFTVLNYFKMGELFGGRDYDTIRREVVAMDMTVNEIKAYTFLCNQLNAIAKSAGLTVVEIDKQALKQFLTNSHNNEVSTYIVT